MKKIISVILAVIATFSIFILPANAISVNYCETFRRAFYELQWYINRDYNNTKENKQFPIGVILDYTYSNCDFKEEYGRGDIGELGYHFYAFPAEYFEALAKEYFQVVNVSDLRSYCGYIGEYNVRYNTETSEYIGINPGGWGGAASYIIYGYTENGQGKYTTYGYVGVRTSEAQYLKMIKENPETENERGYIHTGDILLDGDKEILLIDSYLKSVVSYNGENVKFHSLETIDSLPDINGLITPDTKVKIPTSSTPASSQSPSMTNQVQSSSKQENTVTSQESNIDNHTFPSENNTAKTQESRETSTAETSTEIVSSNDDAEISSSVDNSKESKTETNIKQEKVNAAQNNANWIIIVIGLTVTVIGVFGRFFLLRKKQ